MGAGYVGLVTGVCLAAKGHNVNCFDINEETIKKLSLGISPIYEKDLAGLLEQVLASGHFVASNCFEEAITKAEIVIVAVGTPSVNGLIDLQYVEAVAKQVGLYMKSSSRHISVIIKSTVVPGSTDTCVRGLLEQFSGKSLGEFGLGMNPEFLREGEAVDDFMNPDRIVLGFETEKTLDDLRELYSPWNNVDKVEVNARTAELIKYSNNALLALQISAVNELANLAAALGDIDIMDVIAGVRLDKRWSPIINGSRITPPILNYLLPGCGFGGSCFPKDVQALRSLGEQYGENMKIMSSVLQVNELQPNQVVNSLSEEVGGLSAKQVLLLGLSFKPGTDDVRESPSITIAQNLIDQGAHLKAHDPVAMEGFQAVIGDHCRLNVKFVNDWRAVISEVEVVIICTAWDEYSELREFDLRKITVFDVRRVLSEKQLNANKYLTVGKRRLEH